MAKRTKKMTVPPTRMTVKTMAQTRLSTLAAIFHSTFSSSSFRPSSSDGDGSGIMHRHAANVSQKSLFICYIKRHNRYILPHNTVGVMAILSACQLVEVSLLCTYSCKSHSYNHGMWISSLYYKLILHHRGLQNFQSFHYLTKTCL